MQRYDRKKRRGMLSEINVTPFVDVALVLLIIFMVTAPMMQEGIEVNLPREKGKEISLKKKVVISLKLDETDKNTPRLFLDDTPLRFQDLPKEMETRIKGAGLQEAYIRADKDIPYGYVVKAMAIVKDAVINNVGMVVTPK